MARGTFDRPSELARRLDATKLLGHFVAGLSVRIEPPGWERHELEGWTILHEPRLPAHELRDSTDETIGWIVGHPIDVDAAAMAEGPMRVPAQRGAAEFQGIFEHWLYRHGGRFAALVLGSHPFACPDAGATLPVLFDPELKCLASSPFLLPARDGGVPDSELVEALSVFETGSWFTLGATPHAGASLLLPNHSLDLLRWRQSRSWPRTHIAPLDATSAVELIATTFERTLAAVASAGRPNLGFTAGGDSRSFLACMRGHVEAFRFFTVPVPDELGATDLATAPRLAHRFGLDHRVLPWLEATDSDVELFMYRTGCLIGEERGRLAGRTYDQLGGGEVYVSGVGAEMARGIGWRPDDDERTSPTAEDLLARFHLRPHPELVRRAERWLASLPDDLGGLDALTLFHVENRLGGWGGPLTGAYPDAYSFTLYPYAHRTVVEAVLGLPWRDRRDGSLPALLIASRWPELLGLPVNRPPLQVTLRRRARTPARLARGALRRAAALARRLETRRDPGGR